MSPALKRAAETPRLNPIVTEDPPAPRDAGTSENVQIDPENIARLAYSYWEARGCQGGSPEEDWLRAEQHLRAGN
jgi:hypothetical protein